MYPSISTVYSANAKLDFAKGMIIPLTLLSFSETLQAISKLGRREKKEDESARPGNDLILY